MSVQDHGNTSPIAVAKRATRRAEEGNLRDAAQNVGVAIAYSLIAVAAAIGDAAETVRKG